MRILGDVIAELVSMFAGDVRLSVAILAVVAAAAGLIDVVGVDPLIGGCVLLSGCLTVLIGAVVWTARTHRAVATAKQD